MQMPRILSAALVTVALVPPAATALESLRYRDWTVGTIAMILQATRQPDLARVYSLGPVSESGVFQAAMLISENPTVEDGGTKNAVLFECGMHGREWYAAESCYWLIEYLLSDNPFARELISHVDVWVVPQSNPAGRQIDDLSLGNPTRFAYVCDRGAQSMIGKPCEDNSECGTGGHCYTSGWRTNANFASCALGVDPARNFSAGWNSALPSCAAERRCDGKEWGALCTSDAGCPSSVSCQWVRMKYRGEAPFSERETLNLRRFVHNHMLSMVVIVHTNSQEMSNRWYRRHRASRYMTDRLVEINDTGSDAFDIAFSTPPDPRMGLDRDLGAGFGQFSAWLTEPSDAVVSPLHQELDFGTERNISTFYFELPVIADNYRNFPYQECFRTPSQPDCEDGSNSFHPSGAAGMETLWAQAIRDLMGYVIRQGRSPQCPIDANGLHEFTECENRDFGLVGAKIADASNQPGLLDYDATRREETSAAGEHQIVFAVQNFSQLPTPPALPPTGTGATVTVWRGATQVASQRVPVSLDPGARGTYSVNHDFTTVQGSGAYTVEISLDSDDFAGNNTKRFAFRVPSVLSPFGQPRLGMAEVSIIQPSHKLMYRGSFMLDTGVRPDQAGVEVVIHSQTPYVAGAEWPTAPLVFHLPKGPRWWRASNPSQGHWIYHDPKGEAGPVKLFKILQAKAKGRVHYDTDVSFIVERKTGEVLPNARAYAVDIGLTADAMVLSSLATGAPVDLPPRTLVPGDETEDEPGLPIPKPALH